MAELLVTKKAINFVSAIRKFPINAAKMTFLEDADAIDAGLQMRNDLFDLYQGNLKIDIKRHLRGQQKIMSLWVHWLSALLDFHVPGPLFSAHRA
jgi:hypothetical protein